MASGTVGCEKTDRVRLKHSRNLREIPMAENRYGILIASSKYPGEPGLEDLRFPENDVDGMNEVLISPDHGRFTETFVFKNAPHHEILLKINQTLSAAGKNDLVFIYYSGHGKLNRLGNLCLATTNTVLNALESTSIPAETLKSYFDISDCRKKVLILDCCYSGAAGSVFARGGVDDHLQILSKGQGTFIMTASTGIQVAVEKESDKYGVFTKHILEGIRMGDADQNEDGFVDMHELYEYVHEKVSGEGAQEPMKWDINAKGELIIARSGKTSRENSIKNKRKVLFDYSEKGLIPDKVLAEALNVIALAPKNRSPADAACCRLLDHLGEGRITPGNFIMQWMDTRNALKSADTEPNPQEDSASNGETPKPSFPETAENRHLASPSEPNVGGPLSAEPTAPKSRKRFYGIISGFIIASCVVAGLWFFQTGARPDHGLVAHYPFEQGAQDSSSNQNHGTVSGTVRFVKGVVGMAANFGGIDDVGFIHIPNAKSLIFSRGATFAFWMNLSGSYGQTGNDCSGRKEKGADHVILAKGNDRFGIAVSARDHYGKTALRIKINNDLPSKSSGEYLSDVPSGNWMHIAVIIGENGTTVYCNGERVKTLDRRVDIFTPMNSEDLYMGIMPGKGSCLDWWYPFHGELDELRIYNRALTQGEIAKLTDDLPR